MRTIASIVGCAYILATVLGMLGLIDMYVCVGARGACFAPVTEPVEATTI